jgi:hypothetical protein
MSQIPSDQRAVTAVRQTRAASPTAGLAQGGIAISNTPTVQAVDSVSPIASQLAQVLSQAAGTVSQLGQQAELKRYRESVRLADLAKMDADARKEAEKQAKDARDVVLKAQRGAGKATLETQLQFYQERLKSNSPEDLRRTLLSDVEDADKPQEMAQIIRGYLPPDTDEELVTELVQDFVPKFVGAMAARETEILKSKQVSQADAIGSDNADPKVPVSEVWQSLDTFVRSSPLVTRADAYSRAVLPAAKASAETGNVRRVQELVDTAPPEFKLDLEKLVGTAQTAAAKISNEQENAIIQNFTALEQDASTPTSLLRELLNAARDSRVVEPTRLNSLYNAVDQRDARALAAVKSQAKAQLELSGRSDLLNNTYAAYASSSFVGSEGLKVTKSVTIGNEVVTVEVSETPENAIRTIQDAQIGERIQAGETPTRAMISVAGQAVSNGRPVYRLMDFTSNALAKRGLLAFPDQPEYATVLEQSASALEMYNNLGTAAQTAMGLTDDKLAFFEMARTLMTLDIGNDPKRAVVEANRIMTQAPVPLSKTQEDEIQTQAGNITRPWFGTNFDGNIYRMQSDIGSLARVYARGTGNVTDAVERAAKTIEKHSVRYNDNYVRVPNWQHNLFGYTMRDVLETRIDELVASNGRLNAIDGEPLEAKHVEVQFNQQNRTFTFHDMRNLGSVITDGHVPIKPITGDELSVYARQLREKNWVNRRRSPLTSTQPVSEAVASGRDAYGAFLSGTSSN